uniref:Reverse transcriptase family member n=1 Tax=Solanum tuberosum TaxID=4113 RepID=M1B834_SOLTU
MVFIDLEKTYDEVHMEFLWRCLESRDVPVAYIREIKGHVRWSQNSSEIGVRGFRTLPIEMGLHHGLGLSLFLSVLVLLDRRDMGQS